MVKYVLTMLNIGFTFTKNNAKYLINLRIVYTEDFWTLQIEPHTCELSISIKLCGKCVANTQHKYVNQY